MMSYNTSLLLKVIAFSLLIFCWLITSVMASEFDEGEQYSGAKIGMIGSGNVEVDEFELDQEQDFSLGIFYDFPIGNDFHYGLSADFFRMKWSGIGDADRFRQSETLLDMALSVKANLWLLHDRLAFRPGFAVGLGTQKRRFNFKGTNHLTLKVFGEVLFFTNSNLGIVSGFGIWHSPSGGDSDHDIKIGPMFYSRIGILF